MNEAIAAIPVWPSRKISVPPARPLVSRARLLRTLNEAAASGRVALVVAPGGTGKTSLVADWARQAPMPVAWYSLDAGDRDTRRLVSGILAAVERALPGATAAAGRMLEQGAAEVAAMGMLLSALEERPLTLVFDDFHHLDGALDTTSLWDHFFRFRPPTLALALVSRTVPLLGFTSLAASDGLVGIGITDLSFDNVEAAQLLAVHGLDTGAASTLVRRTGGWATGMLLMARAGQGGLRQLRPNHHEILEQIGDEMLASLPADVRAFLFDSVALGPVSAVEADGILERRDSGAMFAELTARGLFVDRYDGVYRYHDLFTEYVLGVFADEAPERLHAIRASAAAWWEAHDDIPRALALLAEDQDWPALAGLLDRANAELWHRRLWGTIISYVEQLPAVYRTVRLLELGGHAHCERGAFNQALALAEAGMAIAVTEKDWLRPAFLAAQTLVLAGRFEEGIKSATTGIEVADRVGYTMAISRLRQWRGWARLRIGLLAEGSEDLFTAIELQREIGDAESEARSLTQLAAQLTEAGQVGDVEDLLARAGAIWRRLGHTIGIANSHDGWARLYLLRGELAQAREQVNRGLDLLANDAHPLSECEVTVTLAEICTDAGDLAEAEQHAAAASERAARLDAVDLLNAALRVRIAIMLARRDRAGARQLIDEARTLAVTPVDSALLDYLDGMHALRARACERATERLGQAAKALEKVHRPQVAARAYLLLGEAALGSGARHRAEVALNYLAGLARMLDCEGYLRPAARMARQVFAERHLLRKLHKRTHLLLDRLAGAVPTLTVLQATPETEEDTPPRPTLHVSPFGQGAIVLDHRSVEASVLPAKARELLFYAARTARTLTRTELLEALWEGHETAAQNLWDASRHLRRLLGAQSWGTGAGRYALRLDVQDDAHEFDQMASAALGKGPMNERLAAAERALELVGSGGYLEWCNSAWASGERARLMARAAAVALTLAQIYESMGRRQDAIAVCRRAARFDPYDEGPPLTLLRLLVAAGQVEVALQEYNRYRHLLRKDLDIEPSAAIQTVAAQLKQQR